MIDSDSTTDSDSDSENVLQAQTYSTKPTKLTHYRTEF